MHAVRRAWPAAALLASLLVGISASAAASASSSGQCTANMGGQWVTVQCSYGSGAGPSGGPGSGQATVACTFIPLSEADVRQLGLSWPPPAGTNWVLMECPLGGIGPGPLAMLLDMAAGAPVITPQLLLQQALNKLQIPLIAPRTAPPMGRNGLVGLPEWYWVPAADWHQLSVTVQAGPVWATATATPVDLSFQPGGGLGRVSCAGPGTAYDPARPATWQHTRCSFTYEQSSASLPGHAYQASVVVSWRVAWSGSGGAGGLLNAALPVPYAFALPVAQAEALVTSP